MALTYGFFNSVNGDRVYDADTISNMFKGLISEGVYESVGDGLRVTAVSGTMTVSVGTGRAIVGDRWVENDADLTVDISASHVTLNRYTAVVLRRSSTNRNVILTTIDGTPASSAVKPTPVRTEFTHDIILAYVYVPAGATAVTASRIQDTRANTAVCGFVTGLITQVDTSELFAQYEAAYEEQLADMESWEQEQKTDFEAWFDTLTEQLNVNTYVEQKVVTIIPDYQTQSYQSYQYVLAQLFSLQPFEIADEDILEIYCDGQKIPEGHGYVEEKSSGGVRYVTIFIPLLLGSTYKFILTQSKIGFSS